MIEKNKIHCMDCLEGLKKLANDSVDVLLTDPPYNVINMEWDIKIDWDELAKEIHRVLKVNGSIYIFGQFPMVCDVYVAFSKYFKFKQDLVWYKNRGFSLVNTIYTKYHENILFFTKGSEEVLKKFGKYVKLKRKEKNLTVEKLKPLIGMPNIYAKDDGRNIDGGFNFFETGMTYPKREYYNKIKKVLQLNNDFDCLFDRPTFNFNDIKLDGEPYTITRKAQKLYGQKSNLGEFKQVNNGKRNPKTVLEYKIVQSGDEYVGHPTQKPIELLKYLLIASSREKEVILDPFIGSGSTAVAAKQLNRDFIGFELSQKYINIANKRLAQNNLDKYKDVSKMKGKFWKGKELPHISDELIKEAEQLKESDVTK